MTSRLMKGGEKKKVYKWATEGNSMVTKEQRRIARRQLTKTNRLGRVKFSECWDVEL